MCSQKLILLLVLASFSVIVSPMVAQDLDNVTISGRVTDQNGAVIPGATVTATLTATKLDRIVVANEDGQYRLIQLPPGTYTLKAAFTNFAVEEKTDLKTIAGQNVKLDFTLKPAGITAETVVVSAANAPQVDTTRTIVGGTVTTHEVESLPVITRSPLDLIL